MPMFARRPSTMSSSIPVDFSQNSTVGQQRQQMSERQYDKIPTPHSFLCWKMRFNIQVTTCSDFPSEAMLWIKDVEMADSSEELKSSRSVSGKNLPNFEMLDAKTASALNNITRNSHFKKKVSLEEQKVPKRGPVSERKTNRLHDLRLHSSDWCSWHSVGLCWWPRGWRLQGRSATSGGPARVPNLRVCKHLWSKGGTRRRRRAVRRKGGRTGLPARVSGRHVVRGRQSSPTLEMRPGEQARLVKDGQNSGEMGGSSPWTWPSAPKCGDTLQAPAGDQRSI